MTANEKFARPERRKREHCFRAKRYDCCRHLIRGKQMVKCSKAEVRRLRTALRWKLPAAQRERIQMVLLRESGMPQPAIAAAMGVR